jgi:hypothetical protein
MQEVLELIRYHENAVTSYNTHLPNADAKFREKLLRQRKSELEIIAALRKMIR